MKKILVVVDMQNDFIDGALGTAEAVAIVPKVAEKIKNFDGTVLYTRDTHEENYMETQEGKNLPVPHCIRGTEGWQIRTELQQAGAEVVDKPTFGSRALAEKLVEMGLDIPEVTRIFIKLRQLGLDVEPVYTVDQAIAALRVLKGGKC